LQCNKDSPVSKTIKSIVATAAAATGLYAQAGPCPARAAIGVAALPRGALVEADGVMVLASAA